MAMACILWIEKWEVYWTDCFFMPQGPGWNPGGAAPEEYPELENLDGFRFEADIYMSKLDI